jgi:hypothetical protein
MRKLRQSVSGEISFDFAKSPNKTAFRTERKKPIDKRGNEHERAPSNPVDPSRRRRRYVGDHRFRKRVNTGRRRLRVQSSVGDLITLRENFAFHALEREV